MDIGRRRRKMIKSSTLLTLLFFFLCPFYSTFHLNKEKGNERRKILVFLCISSIQREWKEWIPLKLKSLLFLSFDMSTSTNKPWTWVRVKEGQPTKKFAQLTLLKKTFTFSKLMWISLQRNMFSIDDGKRMIASQSHY